MEISFLIMCTRKAPLERIYLSQEASCTAEWKMGNLKALRMKHKARMLKMVMSGETGEELGNQGLCEPH